MRSCLMGLLALLSQAGLCFGGENTAADLVRANNKFSVELYRQIKGKEGNLFLSPYSISTALAMTYGGARGNTAREMARVLHFSDIANPETEVHKLAQGLQGGLADIQKKGDVQLAVANSLWPQKNFKIEETFLKLTKSRYGVDVTPVDFAGATEDARKTINTWVEQKTNDKIKELLKPGMLDPLTRLVLANAIYFKGKWALEFDKKLTSKQEFDTGKDKIQTDMMTRKDHFRYAQTSEAQILALAYNGGDVSMLVVLPKDKTNLAKVEEKLDGKQLDSWTRQMTSQEVTVTLPKFKTTSEFNLSSTLPAMGMKDAFSAGKADFSGISKPPDALHISAVVHKAFVDVNEEGTEAAAATAVLMTLSAMPDEPVTFIANRPFLFLIMENKSGSILFLGRVVDPSKE